MPSSGKRSSLYVGLFTACALAGCVGVDDDTDDTDNTEGDTTATTTEALAAQPSMPVIEFTLNPSKYPVAPATLTVDTSGTYVPGGGPLVIDEVLGIQGDDTCPCTIFARSSTDKDKWTATLSEPGDYIIRVFATAGDPRDPYGHWSAEADRTVELGSPKVPQDVTITKSGYEVFRGGYISTSWEPVPRVSGYEVRFWVIAGWLPYGDKTYYVSGKDTDTFTSPRDLAMPLGSRFQVEVRAVKTAGGYRRVSEWSKRAYVTL